MHRYVALIWSTDDSKSGREAALTASALLGGPEPWKRAYQSAGVLVLHIEPPRRSPQIHLLGSQSGVVIGALYRRDINGSMRPPPVLLSDAETLRILDSGGRHLVDSYWGSYLAIVRDPRSESISLLRDPTGTLACYSTTISGVHVFFSEIDDLVQSVPISVSVSWSHLAERLHLGVGATPLSRGCALREIEDVMGGELVTISKHGVRRKELWNPATYCLEAGLEDEQKAAEELRATLLSVTRAQASQHSSILIRLSGGLDSSIVTSCIAQQQDDSLRATCLNFFITNESLKGERYKLPAGYSKEDLSKVRRVLGSGSGDEREFARSVARRWGFELIEIERDAHHVDLGRLWKAPLAPRPSPYVFAIDEDAAETEYASALGATACFTGLAGDTVLYCTFRAIGALDYAYLHPLRLRLLHHVGLTATLSGESIPRVWGKVVKYGLLRANLPAPLDPFRQPHLLTDEAARFAEASHLPHPWVAALPSLCPGKRNHAIGVAMSVPFYHHVYHRERVAVGVNPLASQPVVETCLRIPTYVLLADGVSRGLARRAFRDLLPPEVARRTVKGMPNTYYQRILRNSVSFVRERLLDGILVREGLLDRRKLESYLVEDQPFIAIQAGLILDYLTCEAWAGQWTSRFRTFENRAVGAFEGCASAQMTPPPRDSTLHVR